MEIKIQKFINKINKMHKENAKEHDYAVGIEDFKTELQEEQLLSFYIRKLTEVTENVIKEDKSSGKSFLNNTYLYFLRCVSIGFERNFYQDDGDELYKDVCTQIIELANRLKDLRVNVDQIYDIYANYYIKNMERCPNFKIMKAAQIKNQSPKIICEIDNAEMRLHHKGNGLWCRGHILEIRNIIAKQEKIQKTEGR